MGQGDASCGRQATGMQIAISPDFMLVSRCRCSEFGGTDPHVCFFRRLREQHFVPRITRFTQNTRAIPANTSVGRTRLRISLPSPR